MDSTQSRAVWFDRTLATSTNDQTSTQAEIDRVQFLSIFRTKGPLEELRLRITLPVNGYTEVYRLHRRKE